jgi:hypothetical protein
MKCISIGKDGEQKKVCYTYETMTKFAREVLKREDISDENDLISIINKYMDGKSWDSHPMFAQEKPYVHKPKANFTKDNLISNIQVFEVMMQYEYHFKNFKYIGDCNHDLPFVKKDREKLLIDLRESSNYEHRAILVSLYGNKLKLLYHWTCIYIINEARGPHIYFFDSNGDKKTRSEIAYLIDFIQKEIKAYAYSYNMITLQYDYEHCGIFVIHFINKMLVGGYKFAEIIDGMDRAIQNIGREEYYNYIYSLRERYFNTY